MSRRALALAAAMSVALVAGGCGDVDDLPTTSGFSDCLREAGLRTSGADDAEGRRALMSDPRALACADDHLDSTQMRAALHGAFTREQAYAAVRRYLDQQPSNRGASALTQGASSLFGGMADEDWRDTRRALQLFAWQAWTHEHGVPESFDTWVAENEAHISESDPDAAVTQYIAAGGSEGQDTEHHRIWLQLQPLQAEALDAFRGVRDAG